MAPSKAWQIVGVQENFLNGQIEVLSKYTVIFSGQFHRNGSNQKSVSLQTEETERSYFEVKMLLLSKFLDGMEITDWQLEG